MLTYLSSSLQGDLNSITSNISSLTTDLNTNTTAISNLVSADVQHDNAISDIANALAIWKHQNKTLLVCPIYWLHL